MNCSDIQEMTVDFLYGELPQSSRREFDAHVAGCEACRREIESFGGALTATRTHLAATTEPPPPAFAASKNKMADMVARRRGWPLRPVGAPIIPEDAGGFWRWLRQPWVVPAMAAFGVIALFLIARESITPPDRMGARSAPVVSSAPAASTHAPAAEGAAAPADEVAPVAAAKLDEAPIPAAAPPLEKARESARASRADDAGGTRQLASAAKRKRVGRAEFQDDALSGKKFAPGGPEVAGEVVAAPAFEGRAGIGAASAGAPGIGQLPAPSANRGGGMAAPAAPPPNTSAFLARPARAPAAEPEASAGISARDLAVRSKHEEAESVAAAPAPAAAPPPAAAPAQPPPDLVALGARLFAEGRMGDARAIYQSLLERFPRHTDAPLWRQRVTLATNALEAKGTAPAKAARRPGKPAPPATTSPP
jgi:hypothetical protein